MTRRGSQYLNGVTIDYDVGIVGGGPAGSAMAGYLARAGVRCVVLEAASFPRPHVGESLVPAATRVFRDLGFLATMEGLGFVQKYGASWSRAGSMARHHHIGWEGLDPDCHVAVRFDEREQPGVGQNYTWHVDRARFDQALLEHAAALGAEVRQGVRVAGVDFGDGDPRISLLDGAPIRVRMVADASGRRTLLGRQLRLRRRDPAFDQYAIHSWYRGFDRGSMPDPDHIHIHFLPQQGSWVWQIPIRPDVTSLGVVTQRAQFKAAGRSRTAFFEACLSAVPRLAAGMRGARRIRPLTEEADYSYAMTAFAGDRWVLLGDAARFVDPIFSSGVSIALNSAKLASADVVAALAGGDLTRARMSRFETVTQRGVRNWYDFICLYYRLSVLFTQFINDPAYRLDLLKLLQGDVYDEERPAVLDRMRDKIAEVEANPSHMWHGLLGDVSAAGLATVAG